MRCPKCDSDSIVQIASHNYPVTSVVPFIFGIWSWFFMALLPARFTCRSCHTNFRRYTASRLVLLILFIILLISPLLFILILSL